MAIIQQNRSVAIATPLGNDKLLLKSCSITEQLGRPFAMELELRSEDFAVKYDDIVGQNVTVSLKLPNGSTRYFNGFVGNFRQMVSEDGLASYQATVVPWLWFLTKTSDCRIFQNQTVPDIIKSVFREHGFSDFEEKLSGAYRQWEYVSQYRETDFNFVNRLMEQEGIYYYFTHQDGLHTLVLIDANASHTAYDGYDEITYLVERTAATDDEHIRDWSTEIAIQPGEYAQTDFDFKAPNKKLLAKKSISRGHAASDYEIYDYPGEYQEFGDGENYAKVRIEELQAHHEVMYGESDARGMAVGFKFKLGNFPREDQCKTYLTTSATYHIEGDGFQASDSGGKLFFCNFSAIDINQQFRSERLTPKPSISGPQTAIVVGPAGDEIYTDEFGRVKVQFHWDRENKSHDECSCWIRVAQFWAGKNWGAMFLPRIGHEVIVEFLEGDPDCPIITGRVYNGQNTPPYGLPAEKTKSTIKSDSSKGGGGANEFRFEDKKGAEEIFLHGQKDWTIAIDNDKNQTVGHDETLNVANNRTKSVGVDQSETIGSNKTIAVGANHSETIGANMTLSVGSNQADTVAIAKALTIGAAYQVSVGAAMNETIGAAKAEEIGGLKSVNVGLNSSENVGKNKSVAAGGNISEKAGKNVDIQSGKNTSHQAGDNASIQSGKKMTLTAGDDFAISGKKKGVITIEKELTIKCGKATINIKSNGDITISGKKINVKGSGDIVMKGSKILQN